MINGALSRHDSSNPDTSHAFQLRLQDLDLLFRFQNRTVLSFGPQVLMSIYKTEVIRLGTLVS